MKRKQAKKPQQAPQPEQGAKTAAAPETPAAAPLPQLTLRALGVEAIAKFGRRRAELEKEIGEAVARFEAETALQIDAVTVSPRTIQLGRDGLRGNLAIRQNLVAITISVPQDVQPLGNLV